MTTPDVIDVRRRPWTTWALPVGGALTLAALLLYSADAATEGTVRVTVVEAATDQPTPVRVRLTDVNGAPVTRVPRGVLALPGETLGVPPEALAIMYGRDDVADGFATQPDGAFYADGSFSLRVPPGPYDLTLTKGYEFISERHRLEVSSGASRDVRYTLRRWIDMPAQGWYSSDDHIHLRRSPREDPLILRWIAAEDIHVGNLLQMGDYFTTFFTQYAFGPAGRYEEQGRWLVPGQEEPRTPEIGHTISLGASAYVRPRSRDYYRYDTTFDRVRELGGVTGYAHQGATFHGSRGMTMDVVLGKIDFLELVQFCAPGGPLVTANYYRFLDLGFPLTATAGSDFPWCGRTKAFGAAADEGPRIGDARFYTHVEGPLTFEAWLTALKGGHTFVTTGPMLDLRVDGARPGSTLERRAGDRLEIVVQASGHASDVPLQDVELVVHGEVVRTVSSDEAGQSPERVRLVHELPLGTHGVWVAARARGGPTQVAHTTPVYVRVDGTGFQNPRTLAAHLEASEAFLAEVEAELASPGQAIDAQMSRTREAVQQRVDEARAALARLAAPQR